MTQWRTASALLLVAALGACKDGPTDSRPKSLRVEIRSAGIPFEEETIAPGGSLSLSASVRDATGKEVEGSSALQWRAEPAGVVSLSASTGATVVVQPQQVGTARVIASSGDRADTALVNVANPVTSAVACSTAQPVSLGSVGQVYTTTGDKAVDLCLEGGAGGAEFALIPFNGSQVADARMAVNVTAAGVVPLLPGTQPDPSLGLPLAADLAPRLRPDGSLHLRLLERSHRAMLPRLRAGASLQPSTSPSLAAVPKVGDELKFNVETKSANGCTNPDQRTGRVAAVSERAIVVADVANPAGGFADADYASIAAAFDTLVWPVNTRNFGTPQDIDKNGKVIIFYTRAVNELTDRNSDSYVGGFFFNRDLFPTTGQNACAGSNYAEMFYMLVPDPSGVVNGNARSTDFVRQRTVGVLAHEFQHLINDSRRLYVTKSPVWEETWLNEGLSHIAEELVFYQTSGLGPRQNIGPERLNTERTVTAFNRYAADNVSRFIRYLQAPENASLMGKDELPTRGAAWLFLRYAADRKGGDDAAMWNALVNSSTQGLDNLRQVLGDNPREWMQDWTVSVYADDALPGLQPRFTQPSWNLRALIPALRSGGTPYGRYPLRVQSLPSNVTRSVSLQGGGAAYLRFGIASGQRAAIRTLVGDLPAPSLLKVSVVRTR